MQPERGLSLLPEPSAGDLFVDLEGDQFVGAGGLEYLFGWGFVQDGQWVYHHQWAHDGAQERAVFESFMALAMQRLQSDPGMHIYHYAPYETGAFKRLSGRYGTCVEALDELLRGERFVDLYRVVRQGVVASVERYSIKDLEPFFNFSRQIELREVGAHKRAVEGLLQLGNREIPAASAEVVRQYNEDDCHATLALRDWLERQRQMLVDEGEPVERPVLAEGAPREDLSEWLARIQKLEQALLEGLPEEGRDADEQARWLLAHMLRWHKREENSVWWERFRMAELEAEDLVDERKALGGLRHDKVIDGKKYQPGMRSPAHRYLFEPQDVDLRPGAELLQPVEKFPKFGEILGIDAARGWVDLKLPKAVDPHAVANFHGVFESKLVGTKSIAKCLETMPSAAVQSGGDIGVHNPLADKLLRRIPMAGLPLPLAEPWHVVDHLAGDVLPVQGPPGSGKSHSGARMILRLVRAGKKVGITATSHAVIDNLMRKVYQAAVEEGLAPPRMMHKDEGSGDDVIRRSDDNAVAVTAITNDEVDVLGGTAWLWGHEDRHGLVDTLFIDEAGQMSLANAVACTVATDNMILLGDPQQLAQPTQASHPEGTDVSALQHLIGEHQTLPDDRGLFLAHTYRMHPDITDYISELYYEGRLGSAPGRDRQRIDAVPGLDGTGLRLAHVAHTGNASRSHEEVVRVRALVDRVLANGVFTDHEGTTSKLTSDDILIVAPFNAQVHALQDALPNFPIGTVDKFQGQEAPVVIYSMTCSSAEDAPRGMEFLYDPHRFNVAISRAKALAILVASPALFDPVVKTPRQMQLANALARYAELASG